MKLHTLGPMPVESSSVRQAVTELAATVDEPLRLGIAMLPEAVEPEALLNAAHGAANVPIVGATTGGAAFTERGHTEDGAVFGFLSGDLDVRVELASGIKEAPTEMMQATLGKFAPVRSRFASVLAFADAFATDGENIVAALRQALPPHCQAFGGTAGDAWKFQRTRVFYDGRAWEDAALFVLLEPRTRIGVDVLHGWQPADGGRELTITEVEGNVVRTLNGRNATEVYTEELRRLGVLANDEPLTIGVAALYELGVRTPFREQLKIRAPTGITPDGSIALASSLNANEVARIVTTTEDRLIDAASRLSRSVMSKLSGEPSGAFVFDCAARKALLGDRYGEEVSAFRGASRASMLGMTCFGEIGRFGGAIDGFHNSTAVIAAW